VVFSFTLRQGQHLFKVDELAYMMGMAPPKTNAKLRPWGISPVKVNAARMTLNPGTLEA